jgi:hypothetical protein
MAVLTELEPDMGTACIIIGVPFIMALLLPECPSGSGAAMFGAFRR